MLLKRLELQFDDLQADDAEVELKIPLANRALRQSVPCKPLSQHLRRNEGMFLRENVPPVEETEAA